MENPQLLVPVLKRECFYRRGVHTQSDGVDTQTQHHKQSAVSSPLNEENVCGFFQGRRREASWRCLGKGCSSV